MAEQDRGPLARVIDPAIYPDVNRLTGDAWEASKRAADAVLASEWLAAHDWQVADPYREALAEIARQTEGHGGLNLLHSIATGKIGPLAARADSLAPSPATPALSVSAQVEWGVRNEGGHVYPCTGDDSADAEKAARAYARVTGWTPMRREVTDWTPDIGVTMTDGGAL